MGFARSLAMAAAVAAGCAALPAGWNDLTRSDLEQRVLASLERRTLGTDALLVIDNLLVHGPPAPRATSPLVRELLARPTAAADAERLFQASVPPQLTRLEPAAAGSFDELLKTYLAELAEAQRLLRAATGRRSEELGLEALPAATQLLAIADEVDMAQVRRANELFIRATVGFAGAVRIATGWPQEPKTYDSPIGRVVIGSRGSDRHGPEAALIIDPGGDDVYERAPARGGAVSVIIDLAGNDEYRGSDVALRGLSAIVDMAGDDVYSMENGIAAAIVGASLVLDYAGNDSYTAKHFAQGAAAFGIGALLDMAGNDRYDLVAWGQGLGLAEGVGLLWDRGGDDRYTAAGVPDAFERGSGLSFAQGAAFGHRDRIAGGIGILRDDGGNDVYEAQMFAQGCGYYYGLGLLWDRAGNDAYHAFRYAQGNGVHQAAGVLRDESGNDRYAMANIYGQGMGLDLAVGILVDGNGDDQYRARAVAQGAATANGFGLLADERGSDRFEVADEHHAWRRAEWLRGLPSVGVLLHGANAKFSPMGKPAEDPPVVVQAPTAVTCPSSDPGEALLCRDVNWNEIEALLAEDPRTPLAGYIAMALGRRPPSPPQAERIAVLLGKNQSCNVRALALRAWPTLPAAEDGLRSGCWRLQSAARAALARLGAREPPARLPSFLQRIPPQEDTF
jgi:hypothetical protein